MKLAVPDFKWKQNTAFTSGVLFCCFVLFVSCSHTEFNTTRPGDADSVSAFAKGQVLFHAGKTAPARARFEQLNYGDNHFIPALLEIQKINYINQDWDRFFGLAVYYRTVLLSAYPRVVKNFHQDLLTMEILALLRHCRFEDSRKIINWSLRLARDIQKDSSRIKEAVRFFNLKTLVGDRTADKKDSSGWKNQLYFWPLSHSQLFMLDNPKNLKVRVKSQC